MSIKMMKKAMIGAAGAVALMGAVNAHAIDVQYPGTYTFEGQTTLSASFVTATCNLSLTGDVDSSGNVSVTTGSVSGASAVCGNIELQGFPWTGTADPSNYTLPLNGVEVEIYGGLVTCSGNITAGFSNGTPTDADPSFFALNNASFGICSVTGDLEVQGTDINIYP
ncbi:hypothetical protein ACLD02_10560 [Alloalcanivorax sp. C16-2]|uniref:hypothetical protein n=1 Tax=Alloalcanivorax sp. C16-2 TaxID=3390052 RepID=UPI0039708433